MDFLSLSLYFWFKKPKKRTKIPNRGYEYGIFILIR